MSYSSHYVDWISITAHLLSSVHSKILKAGSESTTFDPIKGSCGVQRDDKLTPEGGVVFDSHFLEHLPGDANVT